MIALVLKALIKELNQFLQFKYELDEEVVTLTTLVNQDGSVPLEAENKIVCTMIGLEQDRMNVNDSSSRLMGKNPPINLNMYALFAANFSAANYAQSLKILSGVIAFFQGKQVFTNKNTPSLASAIPKITVTIANVEFRELTHLWGAIGAKYMPSIAYKIRMISIDQNRLLGELPTVTGTDPTVK